VTKKKENDHEKIYKIYSISGGSIGSGRKRDRDGGRHGNPDGNV
jgi:hypothetical protein